MNFSAFGLRTEWPTSLMAPSQSSARFARLPVEKIRRLLLAEIGLLTQQAMAALKAASGPHGFNIGMNQGEVAGAGIAAHLHQHVVPRWRNDSNFLPIIAKTKALPRLLGEVRDELSKHWPATD
jgi:diadenosine tetraphosphate (Ap4A) HIT family hydrolase